MPMLPIPSWVSQVFVYFHDFVGIFAQRIFSNSLAPDLTQVNLIQPNPTFLELCQVFNMSTKWKCYQTLKTLKINCDGDEASPEEVEEEEDDDDDDVAQLRCLEETRKNAEA